MPITTIASAINGIKSANDILQSLIKSKISHEIASALSDVQKQLGEALDSLIKAKIDQASALDEIKSLKAQIVSFENWDSNIERYKLAPLWNIEAVAYFTKESINSSEPAHALCANCYEQRKKRILHPKIVDGWIHIVCPSPSCDFDVAIGSKRAPKFEYVKG